MTEDKANLHDGTCIIFANASYRASTEFGALMSDFLETCPEKMNIKEMRETCLYFKRTEEGKHIMSTVFEEIKEIGREEGIAQGIALQKRETEREKARAERFERDYERIKKELHKLKKMYDIS